MLNSIDMTYTSSFGYAFALEESEQGVDVRLVPKRFEPPFERAYDWDWREVEDFVANVRAGRVWMAVSPQGQPVGLIELRESAWNASFWVQSLFVDRNHRHCGVGSRLIQTALAHARTQGARALFVETQLSNGPAIRFYRGQDFRICGFNDHLYSNSDLQHDEVALFLVYPLDSTIAP